MSAGSGYVHVSIRNAQNRAAAAQRAAAGSGSYAPAGYRPLRAVNNVHETREPMHQASSAPVQTAGTPSVDTSARGFVLYVGLDEAAAQAQGTSLGKLATQVRAFLATLSPQAQTHAAVALAPTSAQGEPIDVVRQALGDPTLSRRPRAEARPGAPRPSGVLIDLSRREVYLDGETLNLTFKEFELLNFLVENGTRTVGREELLENLWRNAEEIPNERTIDVHIRRLRSKLGRLANTVRTVRGQGYRFYEHPEVVVWAAPEYSI
ncbi:MAG: winged helix-turn-helix domain-containing protein [Glutamicibacter ardleyensis]|uniref:winged helix-turn-helix domain-containing protein n=1 Tax=Glutamicibacter ardleyensis TaxID=225894 RepID=UPI003F9A965B